MTDLFKLQTDTGAAWPDVKSALDEKDAQISELTQTIAAAKLLYSEQDSDGIAKLIASTEKNAAQKQADALQSQIDALTAQKEALAPSLSL